MIPSCFCGGPATQPGDRPPWCVHPAGVSSGGRGEGPGAAPPRALDNVIHESVAHPGAASASREPHPLSIVQPSRAGLSLPRGSAPWTPEESVVTEERVSHDSLTERASRRRGSWIEFDVAATPAAPPPATPQPDRHGAADGIVVTTSMMAAASTHRYIVFDLGSGYPARRIPAHLDPSPRRESLLS